MWQENLEELFRNAKDRFPDVVWEVGEVSGADMMKDVEMDIEGRVEEVWGHKGSLLFFSFLFVFYLLFFFFQRLCMLVLLLLFKLDISRSDKR